MKASRGKSSRFVLVLVTTPDQKTARAIARAALTARAAACANLVPQLESHYWWQGKLERGAEVLVLFKTTSARLRELEKTVVENHPYDTPEFLVLRVNQGNRRYLDWILDSVRQ